MRKHHELIIWKNSRELVKEIYKLTESYPRNEQFGLVSQMRRAAVSVPSNIAEGAARATTKEFCRFLSIARGSLSELETQLIVSQDLGFISDWSGTRRLIDQLFGQIGGLIKQQLSMISEESNSYDAPELSSPHPLPITPHRA